MSKIEDRVTEKMLSRAELGLNKYGVTMERTDLTTLEWLRHAQEESMDMAVYLERLIQDEEKKIEQFKKSDIIEGITYYRGYKKYFWIWFPVTGLHRYKEDVKHILNVY
jgi:hypothetical protein